MTPWRWKLCPPVRPEAPGGKLIHAANTSLDGYLEDEDGSFDWSVPDEEVHAFWNEHERHIGTSLHGRRTYETMRVWESDDWLTTEPAVVREDAEIWRDADKVVYSSTLAEVSAAANRRSPGASDPTSSCWTIDGSATARCTCATPCATGPDTRFRLPRWSGGAATGSRRPWCWFGALLSDRSPHRRVDRELRGAALFPRSRRRSQAPGVSGAA
ncbi:dihydrofolate reductase family protein [Paenibacillus sp. TRM 82003]|nr:dihydrofolate reductase family protein [Kineococcus sp. TRM81007]MCI2238366.1 dihydrofolate reductase family protein [Kineococcus sp. TRM81007]MCI3922120.1 dihydrofolate reductase family protein [Paenibacillus sp. TRM 82003]